MQISRIRLSDKTPRLPGSTTRPPASSSSLTNSSKRIAVPGSEVRLAISARTRASSAASMLCSIAVPPTGNSPATAGLLGCRPFVLDADQIFRPSIVRARRALPVWTRLPSVGEKYPNCVGLGGSRPGGPATAALGRVEVWRGGCRPNISVAAPFVWRCLTGSALAPSPHPAHRTGHADLPHPALGQDTTPRSRATPSAVLEHSSELIGCPISRSLTTSCVCLELRSLPSTGVTRLQRYYEPLRHPTAPGLSLAGVRLVISGHALGLPVLRALSLCMLPPLPWCSGWASSSLISPTRVSLPRTHYRVGLHIVLFEACSAFTHVAACTLARSPNS